MIRTSSIYIRSKFNKYYLTARKGFFIPNPVPSCCGPGKGIVEKIVPEHIIFLRVSAACYIHDNDWDILPPTWESFHASNSRFISNLLSIIETGSANRVIKFFRQRIALDYYIAVDNAAEIFWKIKKDQQNQGQWTNYIIPPNN